MESKLVSWYYMHLIKAVVVVYYDYMC